MTMPAVAAARATSRGASPGSGHSVGRQSRSRIVIASRAPDSCAARRSSRISWTVDRAGSVASSVADTMTSRACRSHPPGMSSETSPVSGAGTDRWNVAGKRSGGHTSTNASWVTVPDRRTRPAVSMPSRSRNPRTKSPWPSGPMADTTPVRIPRRARPVATLPASTADRAHERCRVRQRRADLRRREVDADAADDHRLDGHGGPPRAGA